jgi:hypothetical protein
MSHAPYCLTCRNYYGGAFVCAIHPNGPGDKQCPDYEQGPRYTRELEIRKVQPDTVADGQPCPPVAFPDVFSTFDHDGTR